MTVRYTDGDGLATWRHGQPSIQMDYAPEQWHVRGIRAARFKPCPHCGGAVLARERVLEASRFGPAVIRRAECSNASCGWVYMRTGGTREEFVRAVNERSGERG